MRAFNAAMKSLTTTFQSQAIVREAAEFARAKIVTRTRSGKGIGENGDAVALKPLSDSYKQQRAGKLAFFTDEEGVVHPYTPKRKPKLSTFASPGKSNLTFSGQMLDSLKVISATIGKAVIAPTGRRTGSKLSNKQVSDYVSEERPYLGLTNAEKRGIQALISDLIRRVIR